MPISLHTLRSTGSVLQKAHNISEARTLGAQTAFLCHSHKDKDLVQGAVAQLHKAGWNVYVDWADAAMPETPNRETAAKIKDKIVELTFFLFLATPNSMNSKWCPWELGYADGKKDIEKILVIPTSDNGSTYGSEYLQLYRRVDVGGSGLLEVFSPGYQHHSTSFRNLY